MEPTRAQLSRAFALTIRRLRSERAIAQETLAFKAGVDRSYMGRLERGEHSPTVEAIYRLLPALGISFRCFAKRFEEALADLVPRAPKR